VEEDAVRPPASRARRSGWARALALAGKGVEAGGRVLQRRSRRFPPGGSRRQGHAIERGRRPPIRL